MSDKCVVCGAPLPHGRRKYCSDDCARVGANQLAREVTSQRTHPSVYKMLTCPDCGRTVRVHIKSKRCRECQAEADRRHDMEHKQRKRAGKSRVLGGYDLCERCGQRYIVESGMQRYCKACAAIATAENDRAASRAWNHTAYSDPAKRDEKNSNRRRPAPPSAVCPICGRSFMPGTNRAVYCSEACADAAAKTQIAQYERDHRAEINARKAAQRRDKLAAMTPQELQAYRDEKNRQARANYAKRKGLSR